MYNPKELPMETLDTQTWIIFAAVVVLGLVALGAWLFYQTLFY